jgi:N-acetylneuraminate synthase
LPAPFLNLGGRPIGPDFDPVVIAELGINHEGSLDVAIVMADAAIDAGAEIIKHQTHILEDEMSLEAKDVIPGNADVSIWEIMARCALSESEEYSLMQHVKSRGSIFISTPFSRAAADRLAAWDVPAFKIGSGECNNYPLIRHVAKFGKPVILSTGMNSIESIQPSVEILRQYGVPFALLHVTNIYPTPAHLVRLGAMPELLDYFPDAVIGLSDHSLTNHACFGAVALGASILERHFTDSRERPGPDISCSMDPAELSDLIEGAKTIKLASGGSKRPLEEEAKTIAFAFASVVADVDLRPGDVLGPANIWVRRPGGGDFSARDYEGLFGAMVTRAIPRNTQVPSDAIRR